jgi:uncharacterized protein (DUF433 family)
MTQNETVIHRDPEILGGIPVFVGTRVPFQNLIDSLSAGDTLDDFLRSFPSVARQQAVEALMQGAEILERRAMELAAGHPPPPHT